LAAQLPEGGAGGDGVADVHHTHDHRDHAHDQKGGRGGYFLPSQPSANLRSAAHRQNIYH
jgi:hypothetical protein